MKRVARPPILVVGLAMAVGAAWFALLPALTLSGGPPGTMVGAPTAAAVPSGASTAPTPAPTPTPTPTATPTPAPTPTAIPTPTPLPVTIEARRTALVATLARLRAQYGIPGISATVTFPDGTAWIGTSGAGNVATHQAVAAGTAFAAGSISKTFTSALVLTQVEQGRVALDAPVVSYLPNLVIDPSITVRELLDHTSGLDDFFSHSAIDAALLARPRRVWTAADSLGYVGKPYFRPGAGWHYSNTNYLVLGLLAEKVGGAPLATQLRRRFFAPLGLSHTYYQSVERPRGPIAHGYRFNGSNPRLRGTDVSDGTAVIPFTSVVTAAGGAGSIATNSLDLARWARALYGGRVLQPDTLASLVGDASVTNALKSSVPYGLGVQVITIDGRPAFGHSGRFLGFRAVMRWLPDEGIAIAVMTNQSRTDPNLLVRDLLRSVLGVPPPCPGCPLQP